MKRHFEDLQLGSIELFCRAAESSSFTAAAQVAGVTSAKHGAGVAAVWRELAAVYLAVSPWVLRAASGAGVCGFFAGESGRMGHAIAIGVPPAVRRPGVFPHVAGGH